MISADCMDSAIDSPPRFSAIDYRFSAPSLTRQIFQQKNANQIIVLNTAGTRPLTKP